MKIIIYTSLINLIKNLFKIIYKLTLYLMFPLQNHLQLYFYLKCFYFSCCALKKSNYYTYDGKNIYKCYDYNIYFPSLYTFFFTTYLFTRGTSGRSFEFTWVFKYSDKVSNRLLHLSVIYAAIENNTLRTMNVMNFKLIKKYSQFLVSKHDLLEK